MASAGDIKTHHIPADILRGHIFPHCSIDVRLAFGIPPRRLWQAGGYPSLAAYEERAPGLASLRAIIARRDKDVEWTFQHYHGIVIPYIDDDGMVSPILHENGIMRTYRDWLFISYAYAPGKKYTECCACRETYRERRVLHENPRALVYWPPIHLDGWGTMCEIPGGDYEAESLTLEGCTVMV